tara:strand:- start:298 stop:945 length:648 start_codon:yes stop_codon:yes gene_type:complete
MFLFGSCRIWTSIYKYGKSSQQKTIQSHYADEIIQYIDWLQTKKQLSTEEIKCFRDTITNNDWSLLKKEFNKSKIFVIEISSIKTSKSEEGNWQNLLVGKNAIVDTNISDKIIKINDMLKNKKCIFLCHANTYSRRNLGFIKNRTIIQDQFKQVIKQKDINFIDPSEIIAKYGQEKCLILSKKKNSDFKNDIYDLNHYTLFMHDQVYNNIISFLD